MTAPRLTVVTTNFNYGRFLGQAITSVLDQNYPDLEFMVLDAGSTDESVDVIHRYADRLTCWHSQRDDGPASALDLGLQRATGEWFYYLNSDDFLLPGALARFAALMEISRPQLWISGGRHEVDVNGSFLGKRLPWRQDTHLFALNQMWHAAEGTFLHIPSLRQHGLSFDRRYQNIFDTVLYTKLARLAPPLYVDTYFACMRLHTINRSGQTNSSAVAADSVLHAKECPLPTLFQRTATRLFRTRYHKRAEALLTAAFRLKIAGSKRNISAAIPTATGAFQVMPLRRALQLPPAA